MVAKISALYHIVRHIYSLDRMAKGGAGWVVEFFSTLDGFFFALLGWKAS